MTDLDQKASEYADKKAAYRLSGEEAIRKDFLAGAAARQPEVDALVARVRELETAIAPMLREELDSVEVHPCDINDDSARARQLRPEMQKVYEAMQVKS